MCLIIQQSATAKPLEFADIAYIFRRNSDGFGGAWIDENTGEPKAWKTLPETAQQAWEAYRLFAHRDCVLHWRMATHGAVTHENAHPFRVNDSVIAAHNGVFSGYGSATLSDTREFIDRTLHPLLRSVPLSAAAETIERLVQGSALVLVSRELGITRYGNSGLVHAGNWYSNTYAWNAPRSAYSWQVTSYGYKDDDDEADEWSPMAARWDDEDYSEPLILCDGDEDELCMTLALAVEEDDELVSNWLMEECAQDVKAWAIESALDKLAQRVPIGLTLVREGNYLAIEDAQARSIP